VASRIAILLLLTTVGCSSTRTSEEPRRAPSGVERFNPGHSLLRYLVLGDSTAVGIGGTYEHGIARQTARHLAEGRTVEMKNLAVSGAQITDVLHEQLPRIDGFVPDMVLLDAGANDVTHVTLARSLRRDLDAIHRQLTAINPAVRIVVTGAPDMTTPPRIPWLLRGLAGWRTNVLNDVFRDFVEEHDLTFAPIAEETGPLFARDKSLFDEDDFHPNDRGYATWIAVINRALDRSRKMRG
jgi:acyl-CoA thioesterase I